jgi:hypothetical protein
MPQSPEQPVRTDALGEPLDGYILLTVATMRAGVLPCSSDLGLIIAAPLLLLARHFPGEFLPPVQRGWHAILLRYPARLPPTVGRRLTSAHYRPDRFTVAK